MPIIHLTLAVGALLMMMAKADTLPQQAQVFGDYMVHYNAFTTNFLVPELAREYNILRSSNRAMLNVTVLKKLEGNPATQAVNADIDVNAVNLNSQRKNIVLRKVQEGDAIYYIGEFPVSHHEIINFNLNIKPEGGPTFPLKFEQQFFTQ